MIRINLLGGFEAYGDSGEKIKVAPQNQLILSYFLLNLGMRVSRERLYDLFWRGAEISEASNRLNVALHGLRKQLNSDKSSLGRLLKSQKGSLWLEESSALMCDVIEFKGLYRSANQNESLARLSLLQQAIDIYRDDLLPASFENWVMEERQDLTDLYVSALKELIVLKYDFRAYSEVPSLCGMVLKKAQYDEECCRYMMLSHVKDANKEAAQAFFKKIYIQFEDAGIALEAETLQIGNAIISNQEINKERGVRSNRVEHSAEKISSKSDNLPRLSPRFLLREAELADLYNYVEKHDIVTVTGMGGVGKTSLAIEVGRSILASELFENGVWLIDLTGMYDLDDVIHGISRVFDIKLTTNQDLAEQIAYFFKDKDLLLIMDNCEHLAGELVQLIGLLLQVARKVKVIATSRVSLNVESSVEFDLHPLQTVASKKQSVQDKFSDAAKFLVEKAPAGVSRKRFLETNSSSINQISEMLGGLPLALELAAARLGLLSPEQLLDQFESYLEWENWKSGTTSPRQSSLQATLDWSFELLNERQKELLRRLSVFVGTFSLEAVLEVCTSDEISKLEATEILLQLKKRYLVQQNDLASSDGRFRLLPLIRNYLSKKLVRSDASHWINERLIYFFANFLKSTTVELKHSDQKKWLSMLSSEHENIIYAIRASVELESHETSLEMAGFAWQFWLLKGFYSEGLDLLEQILHTVSGLKIDDQYLEILRGTTVFYARLGNHMTSIELLHEGLRLSIDIHSDYQIASFHQSLSNRYREQLEFDKAIDHAELSLEYWLVLDNKPALAGMNLNLGNTYLQTGQTEEAIDRLEFARSIFEQLSNPLGIGMCLTSLAFNFYLLGVYDESESLGKSALQKFQELGSPSYEAIVLNNLGICILALILGGLPGSLLQKTKSKETLSPVEKLFEDALSIHERSEDRSGISMVKANLGKLHLIRGNFERSKTLLVNAKNIASRHGFKETEIRTTAALANLYLKIDEPRLAMIETESYLKELEKQTFLEQEEAYYSHVLSLRANGFASRSKDALNGLRELVYERANQIKAPTLRATFLDSRSEILKD